MSTQTVTVQPEELKTINDRLQALETQCKQPKTCCETCCDRCCDEYSHCFPVVVMNGSWLCGAATNMCPRTNLQIRDVQNTGNCITCIPQVGVLPCIFVLDVLYTPVSWLLHGPPSCI
jgi:hypothetical protein